ncbi:hypothetical protein B0H67DRAFT_547138 [Lasiosphaeris hirsuta]|uniref:Uncharacterized protein n=1 Tax=Lasiosphaeris hirsuta TaxID=260670 RepID=A0AA39ZR73_9PEZI|nr:hypothetical protein B0H67DRAFT_547138 [Lasiosphaeris hirsuta]
MASRAAASAALAATAVFGYLSIVRLSQQNGLSAILEAVDLDNDSTLQITGLDPLDAFLKILFRFFTPCVARELPSLSLFAAFAAVQVLPIHTIFVLEGLRSANASTIFAFPAVWGIIYQCVPFGIIVPIYCATHIWISPLANFSSTLTAANRAEMVSMAPLQVRAVTGALILGYILPTVLAALPAPDIVSLHTQQLLLAAWQTFPAQVVAWQIILVAVVENIGLVHGSASATPRARIQYSKRILPYILGITGVLNLAIAGVGVTPLLLSGSANCTLREAFIPVSVSAPQTIASLARGVLSLLQYDIYCACGAILIWIYYLSFASSGPFAALETTAKWGVRSLIVGPGRAAL